MTTASIHRVDRDKYELRDTNGETLKTYTQTKMQHPADWIDDATDFGMAISGPYDWEFVDDRPDQI